MNARTLIIGIVALLVLVGAFIVLSDGEAPVTEPVSESAAGANEQARAEPRTSQPVQSRSSAQEPPPDPAREAESPSNRATSPASASAGNRPESAAAGGLPDPADPADPADAADPADRAHGDRRDRAPASAAAEPQDASPEAILRATSRAYEGVRSIRADFEQRLENRLLGRTIPSAGTVYQRQPDRFLMEFSDPAGDLLVSDGEFFWMYYPSADSSQVIRTRRTASGLDLRSQFIGDPVRRFEIDYHGMEAVRDRPAHVMTLTPREPAGYSTLKVWIDADDHFVRRFDLAESNGVVRHFLLSDLAINPSLPDDLFEFTPPPGARVVTR